MTKSHKRFPRHLSNTALILLGRAADSEDEMLLPIPKSVRARGMALERVLRSLLNHGFVEEVPVGLADEARGGLITRAASAYYGSRRPGCGPSVCRRW